MAIVLIFEDLSLMAIVFFFEDLLCLAGIVNIFGGLLEVIAIGLIFGNHYCFVTVAATFQIFCLRVFANRFLAFMLPVAALLAVLGIAPPLCPPLNIFRQAD